jgi:hypothetical protein
VLVWPLQAKRYQEFGNKQIHLKLSDSRVSNPGEINWSGKRLKTEGSLWPSVYLPVTYLFDFSGAVVFFCFVDGGSGLLFMISGGWRWTKEGKRLRNSLPAFLLCAQGQLIMAGLEQIGLLSG